MEIHPTALVSEGARLGDGVTVQAYSVIGENVTIGPGTEIGPHVVIDGWTTIGANNRIGAFVVIGSPPQDLSYKGERTEVVVGDGNVFREYVTVHRGTARGRGKTIIGSDNYFMAYSHVAHDCIVGNHVIMANAATLGGHVQVDDYASLGGLVAIHQFVRIGVHAFIGGKSGLRMDMPPYMLAFGAPAKLYGPNLVGLRRHGVPRAAIQALKETYKIVFRSGLKTEEGVEKVRREIELFPEVETLLQFITDRSKRGITKRIGASEES